MSCGIVFAINRLKKMNIFCISPPRINMAGQIHTFVFDKTGTLTEEGLSVMGFRPTERTQNEIKYAPFTQDAADLTPRGCWWVANGAETDRNRNSTLLAEAMASCTAVTYVNGKLVGDPLDVQMFEATGWVLNESDQRRQNAEGQDQLVIAYVYPQEVADNMRENQGQMPPSEQRMALSSVSSMDEI